MARIIAEFRDRRDLAINWTSKNPVLASGEHGFELDTGKFKIGNGLLTWAELPYFAPVGAQGVPANLQDHIDDPTPHPAYDDMPSLVLLFENGLV